MIDYTADIFTITHGITCVENHFIASLIVNNLDYKLLFIESYHSNKKILEYFLHKDVKFEYYSGIPRLQSIADNLNLASMKRSENVEYEAMLRSSKKENSKNLPLIVKVNPKLLPVLINAMPWRAEHLVSIIHTGEDYLDILNDIPRIRQRISIEDFSKAFLNEILKINILNTVDYDDYYTKVKKCINEIKNKQSLNFVVDKSVFESKTIVFRDAFSVLKIIRNRLIIWLNYIAESFFKDMNAFSNIMNCIQKEMELICKIQTTIEFYRRRKKFKTEVLNEFLNELLGLENKWLAMFSKIKNF